MRFVLLALSVIAATTVSNTPTKAQNYLGAHITMAGSVARIVGSQHFNSV